MTATVYLAGPIAGSSLEEATIWRQHAVVRLNPIKCLSPLRGMADLGEVSNTPYDLAITTDAAITDRDHFYCHWADALFVNFLGAKAPSLGTAMEIAWAYHAHKPIVGLMEAKGNPNDHPMIRRALTYRVEDFSAGLALIRTLLLR